MTGSTSGTAFRGTIQGAQVEIRGLTEIEANSLDLMTTSIGDLVAFKGQVTPEMLRRAIVCNSCIVSATSVPTIDGARVIWDNVCVGYATPEFLNETAQVGLLLTTGCTPNV